MKNKTYILLGIVIILLAIALIFSNLISSLNLNASFDGRSGNEKRFEYEAEKNYSFEVKYSTFNDFNLMCSEILNNRNSIEFNSPTTSSGTHICEFYKATKTKIIKSIFGPHYLILKGNVKLTTSSDNKYIISYSSQWIKYYGPIRSKFVSIKYPEILDEVKLMEDIKKWKQ